MPSSLNFGTVAVGLRSALSATNVAEGYRLAGNYVGAFSRATDLPVQQVIEIVSSSVSRPPGRSASPCRSDCSAADEVIE
jgi:hypothetical protein